MVIRTKFIVLSEARSLLGYNRLILVERGWTLRRDFDIGHDYTVI